jgi:hypothetical protein
MKIKRKRQLEAKRSRIAAGTNKGWLNFSLAITCRECTDQTEGARCNYREDDLTKEKGCVRDAYETKKGI